MSTSASPSSLAYGYDEFYAEYLNVPYNKGLIQRTSTSLPHPSVFSSHNPRDCCLLALHGHIIYPHDERTAKESVKDGASYSKTIAKRMQLFEELVEEFNALQQKMRLFQGGSITVVIDDGPVLDDFPLSNFGGTAIIEAAPQYEVDRKFSKLGQSGRLNHLAQEYGFDNFQKFRDFLDLLDKEAHDLGYPSYGAICVPTRYFEHVQKQLEAAEGMDSILVELKDKFDLLRQQTAFTIEQFIACRIAKKTSSFFVDVNCEGVLISLQDGPFNVTGIVSSNHMSARNKEFHNKWFA